MNPFESPSLELIKLFGKLKIKSKETILLTNKSNVRSSIYRTDILKEALNESAYKKIDALFKNTWTEQIHNFEDFTKLIQILLNNKILIRMDRAPQKLKGPLLKWPKQMQLAEVGLLVRNPRCRQC